ncbi:PIG-L deacetylase family protein [Pareuzebyella sediminis]|uniref:PIG-L deacetylase family protein n=1 Tax=Pareuzebyella sediminis TaxID=2607998 RepID=UPI0011EC34ED|nr:PIG-L family deacetylase [Pareuzebyella sediminis]
MERRSFLGNTIAMGLTPLTFGQEQKESAHQPVTIEKFRSGKPHRGKVLAAIQPHSDDIPIFAGGTVAKLIKEGYTGYLIRTSNDDHAGRGETVGEVIRNNEKDNEEVAKALGLTKVYNLGYRNHRMDNISIQELRGRLIFLFRLLKVDTVISYDPWGHYEENPDHYITAKAVESARWMAGGRLDYPEHFEAGLSPHSVKERYYFARGPQLVNRIVDISETIDDKVASNRVIVTQGPGGNAGTRLRDRLEKEGKYLPVLGDKKESSNHNYIKHFVLDIDSMATRGVPSDREIGKTHGLDWAERFHYIGPTVSKLEEYIEANAKIK